MSVGSRIKQARENKQITQEELGVLCGTSKQNIFKYENGIVTNIPFDRLERIAEVLDVSPAYLMGWEPDKRDVDKFTLLKPDLDLFNNPDKSPSLSEDALQVAQDYSSLDKPGQRVVRVVIADQKSRVAEEKKQRRTKKYEGSEFEGQETGRSIPHYFTPSAAGYASPAFDEDFEYIEVGGDVPPFADFAVDIDGDSMEPYIMSGSTVYVNRDPLANGDVGIFFCDGDMLCKQYYHDEWGNVWLLSLNRDRADADKFIEAESGLTLVCYGRVILPHPLNLAVPENELL